MILLAHLSNQYDDELNLYLIWLLIFSEINVIKQEVFIKLIYFLIYFQSQEHYLPIIFKQWKNSQTKECLTKTTQICQNTDTVISFESSCLRSSQVIKCLTSHLCWEQLGFSVLPKDKIRPLTLQLMDRRYLQSCSHPININNATPPWLAW